MIVTFVLQLLIIQQRLSRSTKSFRLNDLYNCGQIIQHQKVQLYPKNHNKLNSRALNYRITTVIYTSVKCPYNSKSYSYDLDQKVRKIGSFRSDFAETRLLIQNHHFITFPIHFSLLYLFISRIEEFPYFALDLFVCLINFSAEARWVLDPFSGHSQMTYYEYDTTKR